jgi:hypothetical protein
VADAHMSRERVMPERYYSVAGRVVRVATSGDLALQLSAAFMQSCCFTPAERSEKEVETGIRVHSDRGAPAIPRTGSVVPLPPGRWRMTATEQYFEMSDSTVRVRPAAQTPVDVWIGTSRPACRRHSLLHVMANAVHAALRRCALYGFHGAGLALPQRSDGVLIAGASGSGKSTLALRLAQSGWRYLSDDSLLVYDTPSGVTACGLRRPFAVSQPTVEAFAWPRLSESLAATVLTDPHKYWLYPEGLFPGQAAPSMSPAVLVFPVLTGEAHSRLGEVRPAEALSRLVRVHPWAGGYDVAGAHDYLRVLGQLARQVRSYVLMAGTDLLKSPGRATDVLEPLLER